MLRADMRDFEQQALEYDRLRVFPSSPLLPEDLRALVQTQAEAAGISDTLALVDATNTYQVHVAFSTVPFADWLSWVEEMQLKHLRFKSGRIEGRPESGMVDVAATFVYDSAE